MSAPDPRDDAGSEEAGFADAKPRDAALVLPLVGLALFMPPLLGVFNAEETLFGAPLILVCLFTAWTGLAFAAFLLSRRLRRALPARGEGE